MSKGPENRRSHQPEPDGTSGNGGEKRGISRRGFLALGGAGVLGAAGAGLAGIEGYRRFAGDAAQGPPVPLAQSVGRAVRGSIGIGDATGMNFIVVVMDSLRKDHIGAYGATDVRTPNLDAFAGESLRFNRAVPEAMPTMPARRSIHTGMRSFPFRDWYTPKSENVRLYGWQPVPEDQWTVAEMLRSAGYQTLMVSDNNHFSKASYNFQRGFGVFDFIRGQERDLYVPASLCPEKKMENVLMLGGPRVLDEKMRQYFANTLYRRGEEDYFAPQVFGRASRWLDGLKGTDQPFFMVVDSFDPHEPWDPPDEYVRMYGESYDEYPEAEPYAPVYGENYLNEKQTDRMRTLYRAEITMVDRWFGKFMDRAEELGLLEDTVVLLVSDHGVSFGEHGTIGKPHNALWPEVTDVPFMIRHPGGKKSGRASEYRASTHDVVPTVLSLAGVTPPYELDGADLSPLLDGEEIEQRRHFSAGMHDWVVARDDEYAMISTSQGGEATLYDLREDPDQQNDIAPENREVVERMYRDYVQRDAGGELPDY